MGLPSLTYERYTELGYKLDEDSFNASLRAATAAVKEIIGYNEPMDEEDVEAYERAICAGISVDYEYGASGGIAENVSSIRLGRFDVSMGGASNGSSSSYDHDISRAIIRELMGSSLLYQGIA